MSTDERAPSATAGAHGGELVAIASARVEVTVVERGGSARFRLYFFDPRDRPAPPPPTPVTIEVRRPDASVEAFAFRIAEGFLESFNDVAAPYEFELTLVVDRGATRDRDVHRVRFPFRRERPSAAC